jgi:hypothetical protein
MDYLAVGISAVALLVILFLALSAFAQIEYVISD